MRQLIELEEALSILLQSVNQVGQQEADLTDAGGRVLAADFYGQIDLPPFNRSPLDGYAVRAEDIAAATPENPIQLHIAGEVPAGTYPDFVVSPGQAAKILTGAPIPSGADVIIKQEDLKREGANIFVSQPLSAYSNFCYAGEDIKRGELLLEAGKILIPEAIGVLASQGMSRASVFKQPLIGILSTGSELVDVSHPLSPGQIYNSNQYNLASRLRLMGCQVMCKGTITDRVEAIATTMDILLQQSDLIITTGGVSVGDYDLTMKALQSIGAEILFWRVNKRPGTPALAAIKQNKLFLCLSGNPAAAITSFYLLGMPVIKKLQGLKQYQNPWQKAVVQSDYSKTGRQRRFLRGNAYIDDGRLMVQLNGKQKPNILTSLLESNALVDIPANSKPLQAGDLVNVLLIDSQL